MPLSDKIREKISNGTLPTQRALKVWVGPGKGARCDGCDFPITDLEYEFDVLDGGALRFHRTCFNVWDLERKQTV
jgi:hypothetical protein